MVIFGFMSWGAVLAGLFVDFASGRVAVAAAKALGEADGGGEGNSGEMLVFQAPFRIAETISKPA